MATKRAEVDAALSLPGVSGVFTQDIEQYPDALGINDIPPAAKQKPRKAESQTKIKEPSPQQDPDENRVINAFLDNDLRTTGLIIKKKDESVWIQHPTGFTEEQFNKHQAALDEAEFNSEYHPDKNAWEIPLSSFKTLLTHIKQTYEVIEPSEVYYTLKTVTNTTPKAAKVNTTRYTAEEPMNTRRSRIRTSSSRILPRT
jgi:hypothetical protein